MQNVALMLCLFASCNAASLGNEEVMVVGLAEDVGVYETAVSSNSITSNRNQEQSLSTCITNNGAQGAKVGFHAYLPDDVELYSFTMENEGVSYRGKKTSQQHAQRILETAHEEGHNAAIYTPKSLTSDARELQATQNNVNIRPHHEVTFQLLYSKAPFNLTNKNANQAHVSLDVSSAVPQQLLGKISSPNYPSAYPNNALFTWSLRASYGSVVSISFTDYSIESCCDRLTLHDGASSRGHIIAEIAGEYSDASEVSYSSSKNFMFLRLTTDCSVANKGFSAVFTTVSTLETSTTQPPISSTISSTTTSESTTTGPVAETTHPTTTTTSVSTFPTTVSPTTVETIPTTQTSNANTSECSGDQTLQSYTYPKYLISAGYPNSYENNVDCSWTIVADIDDNIEVSIIDMDLESCCDKVYVYDGPTSSSPRITTLTGNVFASEIVGHSTQNEMYIRFTSDSSVFKKGFRLSYKSLSGLNYTETEAHEYVELSDSASYGYINFPLFGTYYTRCTWHIHNLIRNYTLQIDDEYPFTIGFGDTLRVYDGPSSNAPLLATVASGDYFYSLQTTGSDLFLEFLSNNNFQRSTFELRYKQKYACLSPVPLPEHYYQYISSPGYPTSYFNNMNCYWRLSSSQDNEIVELTFLDNDVEVSDRLQVSYYGDYTYIQPWQNLSGVTFRGTSVGIDLVTDQAVTARGFRAKYRSIPIASDDIDWGTPCPTKQYVIGLSGSVYLYDDMWRASCLLLPALSNSSSVELKIVSSTIVDDVTELTVNSFSMGVLQNVTDFYGLRDYTLGNYSSSDLYVRLKPFPKASYYYVSVSYEIVHN
ncbi:scavenger receptor cysteine-rich domain-containing protein DMBT1-like [Clavelina lepadiformis]|uniref:scavenger receptor cysteine-rich domain-containing protein DMBT1-like n=1 Tax=Clavelina lepadiformis TaxID=159417 RepID=UPI0040427E15